MIVLCGVSDMAETQTVAAVFETNPLHLPFEEVLPGCKESLYTTVFDSVAGFLKKIEKNS